MLALLVGLLLGAGHVEPVSRREVPATIQVDGQDLSLTGAAGRRYLGTPVYALAHYALPGTGKAGNITEKLDHWQQADTLKVVVFFGTVDVPAQGLYYSWKANLERAGYTGPNWEPFYSSFTEDFTRDCELRVIHYPGGRLRVELNGRRLGEWDDPELSAAVWRSCLGEGADLENRKDLVSVDDLSAPAPDASGADAAPAGA